MVLKNKRIGVAMTGSFCTYTKAFEQIDRLLEEGAILQTIFSDICLPKPLFIRCVVISMRVCQTYRN